MKKELLLELLRGSIRYEIHREEGLLEIEGYRSGERLYINLNEISEDALLTEEEFEETLEDMD